MKQKYLMLYLKTGAGHISAAQALSKYLTHHPDKVEVESVLVDGFAKANRLIKLAVVSGYRFTQSKARWIFELLYAVNKIRFFAKMSAQTVSFFAKPYLRQVILAEKPDKILVFHFFLCKAVLDLVKELNLQIPVLTLATDPYTAPPIWFVNRNQHYIVFSERVKNQYTKQAHIPADNFHVFRFMLDEKFTVPATPQQINELKIKYGFAADKKLLLILGGGDGIPKGKKMIRHLVIQQPDYEIAMVCGRDIGLNKYADHLKQSLNAEFLKIYGFVDFVYDLVNMADVIVTKGGPATIMEILILRKIPVVNTYIWEQEKGNVDYLIDNRLGIYEPVVKKLPHLITNLLQSSNSATYLKNIDTINIQNGTKLVAEFVTGFNSLPT